MVRSRAIRRQLLPSAAIVLLFLPACGPSAGAPSVRSKRVQRPCPGPNYFLVGPDGRPIGNTLELIVGHEYLFRAHACSAYARPLQLTWTIADTSVAGVVPQSDSTALVTAKREGVTRLSAFSPVVSDEMGARLQVTPKNESGGANAQALSPVYHRAAVYGAGLRR